MMQNSYLSDKKILKSMGRLNQAFSDKKIRVKSFRIKTQEKNNTSQSLAKSSFELPSILKSQQLQPVKQLSPLKQQKVNLKELEEILLNRKLRVKSSILLQKDYQKELEKRFSIPKSQIQQIYRLKIEQDQIKYSEQKYLQFCKLLYLKVADRIELCMQGLNLKGRALQRFLQFYLVWKQKSVIGLDLSLCSELTTRIVNKRTVANNNSLIDNDKKLPAQQPSDQASSIWPMNSLLLRLIQSDNNRLTKLSLRNLHLSPYQLSQLLSQIIKASRIYSLDISNKTSQSINRLGNNVYYLENFFTKNQSVAVMKMDNLNINDQCIEKIAKGMGNNVQSMIKILSLSGNFITSKSATYIHNMLTKVGLQELTLSNNPLAPQFYLSLKSLRSNTVKYIDLSSTNMNSQALVNLLTQLAENKCIQTLILDNNDFANHWFNKVGNFFSQGFSLQQLSMANCEIKNFDQLFQGIQHSRYLTKINLNYNIVNIENEDVQKVVECFKINKILKSVKMRFCGYNQPLIIKLLDGLRNNRSLEFIDLSQNHMSDLGAKHIVKLLNENSIINQVGIEKLQLTVKMIHEITSLMQHNQSKRQKKDHINLIDQNKMYKLRDTHSWNDIHILQSHHRKLQNLCQEVKIKNSQLEIEVKQKRQSLLEYKNSKKLQVNKLDEQIKKKQHLIQSNLRHINQEIDKIVQMQQRVNEALQIEKNLISTLEHKILKENQKIKRREVQFQSMLRDEKYLNRKKNKLEKQPILQQKKQRIQSPQKDSSQLFANMRTTQSSIQRKIVINSKKE